LQHTPNSQEDDITKMLAATTHIGSDNSETTMEQYIFKKKTDGINIINLKKTWEKLVLAARAIAAVENPGKYHPFQQFGPLKCPARLSMPCGSHGERQSGSCCPPAFCSLGGGSWAMAGDSSYSLVPS
jgi:hypothetical protein